MIRIDSIEIRDFRGFPADSVSPIRLQGKKNLLIYGENGSGKSTIFHALKHLFDSKKRLEYDSDTSK